MKRQLSKRIIALIATFTMVFAAGNVVLATESEEEELVTRLYTELLGREGSEEEVAYWSGVARSGNVSGTQLVMYFLESEEFLSRGISDTDFVSALYTGILGREGGESEIGYWNDFLQNGTSRFYVVSGILRSSEFGSICAACNMEQGNYESTRLSDTHLNVSAFVARLYKNCLGRRYDRDGLNYWLSELLNKKKGGLEVARGFFTSDEFIGMDLIDEQFVTVCYETLLGRRPELDGLRYWVSQLGSKAKTRNEVLELFCTLPEFRGLCDEYGIFYSTEQIRDQYPEACAVLDKVGWDIRKAYDWSVGITYVRSDTDISLGTRNLAHNGFTTRKGNCYVYAATFYEMTKAMGYDSHQIVGYVKNRNGGLSPHSWVEIDMEGTTYVFDPEFEQTKDGRDGWKFKYGRSGTWMYADYKRVN
ncbi:MAG: DUF4214 domain-containing protein [Clostridiales bacterium]|nr:DUF4214 domain-containing protein [Clostridiales bacterium]